jgi:hypothetical protein
MSTGFLSIRNLLMLVCWTASSCVEPYSTTDIPVDQKNLLVVNAYLNTESDSVTVKLSRSKPVGSVAPAVLEAGANVTIEDEHGNIIQIPERSKGDYFRKAIAVTENTQYRLNIKTADSKTYQSEFVLPLTTPAIDSVSWKATANGVDIYVNSHDPTNGVDYYRWDYDETFQFHSALQSLYYYDKASKQVLGRTDKNQIYVCWKTIVSAGLVVGSTAQLTKNEIHEKLYSLPSSSEKLSNRYSVLVRQYAIDDVAFSYWANLEKLAKTQGTLFDAQPADVAGNVLCLTNPLEKVLGYFSAGNIAQKRIFISYNDLPSWPKITSFDDCRQDALGFVLNDPTALSKTTALLLAPVCDPIMPNCDLANSLPAYSTGPSDCVDCTLRLKATTTKPSFWP